MVILFSVYLSHVQIPIPNCRTKSNTKKKRFPVFQVFPVSVFLNSIFIVPCNYKNFYFLFLGLLVHLSPKYFRSSNLSSFLCCSHFLYYRFCRLISQFSQSFKQVYTSLRFIRFTLLLQHVRMTRCFWVFSVFLAYYLKKFDYGQTTIESSLILFFQLIILYKSDR